MTGAGYGAIASLAGGMMEAAAAQQAQGAMGRAFESELNKQAGYRNQALSAWQPSLFNRSVENALAQLAQGAAERQGLYARANATPMSMYGINYPSSQMVGNRLAMEGQQRAHLGAYNDWELNQLINNIRANEELNRIQNFAQGTASVFPYRMYEAQHSADELATWGKIIASIGGGAGAMMDARGPTMQQSSTSPYAYQPIVRSNSMFTPPDYGY